MNERDTTRSDRLHKRAQWWEDNLERTKWKDRIATAAGGAAILGSQLFSSGTVSELGTVGGAVSALYFQFVRAFKRSSLRDTRRSATYAETHERISQCLPIIECPRGMDYILGDAQIALMKTELDMSARDDDPKAWLAMHDRKRALEDILSSYRLYSLSSAALLNIVNLALSDYRDTLDDPIERQIEGLSVRLAALNEFLPISEDDQVVSGDKTWEHYIAQCANGEFAEAAPEIGGRAWGEPALA